MPIAKDGSVGGRVAWRLLRRQMRRDSCPGSVTGGTSRRLGAHDDGKQGWSWRKTAGASSAMAILTSPSAVHRQGGRASHYHGASGREWG